MDLSGIIPAMEAVLFASGDPVPVSRLAKVLDCGEDEVEAAAGKLSDGLAFERRGIRLVEMDGTYQLISAPEFGDLVGRALETRRTPKLSAPALETIAVIAYHQPATKAFIEQIRGVDSSYTVGMLLDRGLIEDAGRLPVPGRPILYRTSQKFLRSFGLKSIDELPELPEEPAGEEAQAKVRELAELAQKLGDGDAQEAGI